MPLSKELSNYPTKEDLRNELANYATKEDLRNEIARVESRFDALEADLARRFKAMEEWLLALVNRVLEPFVDHGARITQLEARTTVLTGRVDTLETRRRRRRPGGSRRRPRRPKARSR